MFVCWEWSWFKLSDDATSYLRWIGYLTWLTPTRRLGFWNPWTTLPPLSIVLPFWAKSSTLSSTASGRMWPSTAYHPQIGSLTFLSALIFCGISFRIGRLWIKVENCCAREAQGEKKWVSRPMPETGLKLTVEINSRDWIVLSRKHFMSFSIFMLVYMATLPKGEVEDLCGCSQWIWYDLKLKEVENAALHWRLQSPLRWKRAVMTNLVHAFTATYPLIEEMIGFCIESI